MLTLNHAKSVGQMQFPRGHPVLLDLQQQVCHAVGIADKRLLNSRVLREHGRTHDADNCITLECEVRRVAVANSQGVGSGDHQDGPS